MGDSKLNTVEGSFAMHASISYFSRSPPALFWAEAKVPLSRIFKVRKATENKEGKEATRGRFESGWRNEKCAEMVCYSGLSSRNAREAVQEIRKRLEATMRQPHIKQMCEDQGPGGVTF